MELDALLVERCLTGDPAAWEQLVRAQHRRVYILCYRFTGRAEEAEDLAQDVFLRVFKTLKSFRAEEGHLGTWLTSLTRNLLIDHYRKTRKDRVLEPLEDQLPVLEERRAVESLADSLTRGREAGELLQAALARLSPDLREAVILRDLQEMEYREIATVLNVPEGTVKSRINRGRTELGRLLRQWKVAP
ncbi:MAG: sigma-70 family RNA polymerase sigma factor [Acidobacteria bacterium]|nr:sigma-70 family RNA polymerase sigma factor [Acidobacteriota bacterium]